MTMRHVLAEIQRDAAADAEALDGRPFTGKAVGEMFGNVLAMVDALARQVEVLNDRLEQVEKPRSRTEEAT